MGYSQVLLLGRCTSDVMFNIYKSVPSDINVLLPLRRTFDSANKSSSLV